MEPENEVLPRGVDPDAGIETDIYTPVAVQLGIPVEAVIG
jgi:hypothetical protein